MRVNLVKDNILKALIVFAMPILISNIFQQLYNTMDTMIIGNILGDKSLAAIGACAAVYELLIGFALGIGNGLSIVIARAYGAGDKKLLKYISTITIFVGVMFAYNLLAGLLRAIGNSLMPLVFLIISSVINVILDLVFIGKFNMGIKGAAVATVIAQGISAVLCLIYIVKKCKILIPDKNCFKLDRGLYGELVGQGLSMGFMMSIVSAGTIILQSAINSLGYLIIAGHIAARKLNSFCMMPGATVGMALATFVSQNKGAKEYKRVRQGVKVANILVISWGIVISIILFFTAPLLVKGLSGSNEEIIINNGALYLIINAPFYTVLGILLNLRNSLQGLGEKLIPLISSVIECLGKCIFVALLIPKLNYMGVIICEPIIWCCMTVQLAYSFYKNPLIKQIKYQAGGLKKSKVREI